MAETNFWLTYVIPIASGVTPILLAIGGAVVRICKRFDRIEAQNAVQTTQLDALTKAVDRLSDWALGREGR